MKGAAHFTQIGMYLTQKRGFEFYESASCTCSDYYIKDFGIKGTVRLDSSKNDERQGVFFHFINGIEQSSQNINTVQEFNLKLKELKLIPQDLETKSKYG